MASSLESEAATATATKENVVAEGKKPNVVSNYINNNLDGFVLVMRMVASFATASATLVMALNKEVKTLVVATVGSVPVTATVSARFHHTPAFM